MVNIKVKGISINLVGTDYVVPPIALGNLEALQDRIAAFTGDVTDTKQVSTVIDTAFASLVRNYPEMTREQVGQLVDVGNMIEVFEAVTDVSGLKRKRIEAEKAEAEKLGEVTPV
jgi:hypothetical protein